MGILLEQKTRSAMMRDMQKARKPWLRCLEPPSQPVRIYEGQCRGVMRTLRSFWMKKAALNEFHGCEGSTSVKSNRRSSC